MDTIQTIMIALIGGGLVGFIQFLIQRHDKKHDKNAEVLDAIGKLDDKIIVLKSKIDNVDRKYDERSAISSRVRILRFMDEILEGRKHSKDSFEQVLDDIDHYESYCEAHPNFKNNQTVATVTHIKKNYEERLEKHDFL